MAKKTREQKIIADLRRQLQQQQPANSYSYSPKNQTPTAIPNTIIVDYSHVKKDLLKTVILTVLAIGVQLVLWYGLNKK